jgi:hypothetical protein
MPGRPRANCTDLVVILQIVGDPCRSIRLGLGCGNFRNVERDPHHVWIEDDANDAKFLGSEEIVLELAITRFRQDRASEVWTKLTSVMEPTARFGFVQGNETMIERKEFPRLPEEASSGRGSQAIGFKVGLTSNS